MGTTTIKKTGQTKLPNGLGEVRPGKRHNGYKGHPYLSADFWAQPANRFWNNALYSAASKDYFDNAHPVAV